MQYSTSHPKVYFVTTEGFTLGRFANRSGDRGRATSADASGSPDRAACAERNNGFGCVERLEDTDLITGRAVISGDNNLAEDFSHSHFRVAARKSSRRRSKNCLAHDS